MRTIEQTRFGTRVSQTTATRAATRDSIPRKFPVRGRNPARTGRATVGRVGSAVRVRAARTVGLSAARTVFRGRKRPGGGYLFPGDVGPNNRVPDRVRAYRPRRVGRIIGP